MRHLEKGRLVIFAAGTGNPYFSTDTAAALRAMEIQADCLCKATKVEGIYAARPGHAPRRARCIPRMTFDRFLAERIGVMDATAVTLCRDNQMPIRVFKMATRGNIKRVVLGEPIGTIVDGESPRRVASVARLGAGLALEDAARRAASSSPALLVDDDVEHAAGQAHLHVRRPRRTRPRSQAAATVAQAPVPQASVMPTPRSHTTRSIGRRAARRRTRRSCRAGTPGGWRGAGRGARRRRGRSRRRGRRAGCPRRRACDGRSRRRPRRERAVAERVTPTHVDA